MFEGDGGAHGWGVFGGGERGPEEGGERERDNTIGVWDVETGECLKVMEGTRVGEVGGVERDGKRVVSGAVDER